MVGKKGMQMRGAGPFSAPAWGLLPAVLAVAVTGCTMCPDPFDYSGPVPNGSPPQNDFRARSNGILPIGGTPKPWPAIVKKSPASRGPAVPRAIAKGEVRQLSAEMVAGQEEPSASRDVSDLSKPPPSMTPDTVAVIGESDEAEVDSGAAGSESPEDEPVATSVEEPSTDIPDAAEAETSAPTSDEPVATPATTPTENGEAAESTPAPQPPASDDSTGGESADEPATEESTAEPAAVDPPPDPAPTSVLRETPGWRPRRPLSPGLFAP